ncbi:MAG TPA: hypothetical protein VGF25_18040, partial [Thermoleophilaceae bacterium]
MAWSTPSKGVWGKKMSGGCPAGQAWKHAALAGIAVLAALAVWCLTGPAQARPHDKDGDGLRDRYERRKSHTNPRRADTDGDRLRDRYELRRSHTNPRRRDTDRDGLGDRYELRRSHTNPRRRDTDRDGLSDRYELRRSHTNPRKRDTDGDGVSDGVEVRRGTDPLRKPGTRRQVVPPGQPGTPRAPAASAFPTAATTGVPDGWAPSATTSGNLTVTTDGAVVQGQLVTGSILVRAQNVTIRNSRVYGQIYNQVANQGYNGLLVEDTEIGADSGT